LDRNIHSWEIQRQTMEDLGRLPRFTIALSREAGTHGTQIANEVANRLGWLVYDRELLEKIAQEMGIRTSLLESVDEKRMGWLQECIQEFMSVPTVTASAFTKHLIQTVLALGAHGDCVIVGRGASFLLPLESTLRVRLVAPLEHRITVKSQQLGISPQEASAQIEGTDRNRIKFVRDHFQKDTTDPHHYDLVLNTLTFSVVECADLILEALNRRQKVAASRNGTKNSLQTGTKHPIQD